MSTTPPQRDDYEPHQCACRIVWENPQPDDRCDEMVYSPDEPFCSNCQRVGHPELENQRPVQVWRKELR